MIYLITGKKRAGKDTTADFLKSYIGGRKIALADPMKMVAQVMFDWDYNHIEHYKETVDPRYGISPRQFLQTFGTEYAQFYLSDKFPEYKTTTGRTLWAKYLVNTIKKYPEVNNWFVSDVRFPHEVEEVTKAFDDVKVLKIIRPDHICKDEHCSETSIDEIISDVVMFNTGTLTDYDNMIHDYVRRNYSWMA